MNEVEDNQYNCGFCFGASYAKKYTRPCSRCLFPKLIEKLSEKGE